MKKLADRVFLLCAAAALLSVPALTLARVSARQSLYYENRTLADKPAWDWEAVLEGDWFSGGGGGGKLQNDNALTARPESCRY